MKPAGNHAGRESRAWTALAGYAIVTFAWTWTFWWGGVIAGVLSIDVPVGLVVFLGGPGPLLGALFVLRRSASSYRRGFLGRIVDPRRVAGAWWLATVAVAVLPIAVLAHAGTNIAGSVIPQDALTDLIRTAALVVAVIAVIGLTRGDLAYRSPRGARAAHAASAGGGAPGDRVGVAWAPAERTGDRGDGG